ATVVRIAFLPLRVEPGRAFGNHTEDTGMAMETANSAYVTGRLEELQKENEALRDQLRRLSVHETVARGALTEATGEREAAERLVRRVAVEEQATRAEVEA